MEISSAPLALEEAFFNASCKSPDWISLKLKNGEPLSKAADKARANSAAEALGCAQETEGKCLLILSAKKDSKVDDEEN